MSSLRQELEDRFLRYVKIDTASDEFSKSVPSTMKQYDLLNLLADELKEMGAQEVTVTDYATVFGTIPATPGYEEKPSVAFFAHVDTSPAYSGTNVNPIVHRNYQGVIIDLPADADMQIDPEESRYLKQKLGEDIVTADGSTLLGADDKAGVAICMALGNYLLNDPEIAHGKIVLAFTPDEEVGRGVSNINLTDVGADFAYTLDGSERGEIIYETFSADKGLVTIEGVSIHPGYAKDKMVNALHLAGKFMEMLPQQDTSPETTSGREGFIHLYEVSGTATKVECHMIIRDFEMDGLEAKGALIKSLADQLQALEPRATVKAEIFNQYRNMRYWLEKDMRPVELAREACKAAGIDVITKPIRGGTDGSRLTEMGLPTPNLFTGMQNFHGPLEWVSLHDMEASTLMCVKLAELWADQ
ncbi:MAG: peptidase T [Chloroflexota bacterium]